MASTALVKLREQVSALKNRNQKAVKHARRGFKVGVDALVIGGTGFVAGMAQGRFGAVKIPHTGIPVDLALAAGAYVTGMLEPFGEGASHTLFLVGHGLVTSHLVAMGRGAGKNMRTKAGKPALMEGAADADAAGFLEGLTRGGGALSDDDLVEAAKQGL